MSKKLVPLVRTALLHKCPACGKGDIYASPLKVADVCAVCGFALKEHDAGDGPAFFAMFVVGILVTSCAALVDVLFSLPLWLHMVIWTPVIIGLSVYLLKVMKSWLIGMQYRHKVPGYGDKK